MGIKWGQGHNSVMRTVLMVLGVCDGKDDVVGKGTRLSVDDPTGGSNKAAGLSLLRAF